MFESFEIPVNHKGQELQFPAKLLKLRYIHKFRIDVNGTEIFFEQDDEGKYRALIEPSNLNDGLKIEGSF